MKTAGCAGIRRRFAEILKDSGLSVKQLSQTLNISQATVMRLMNETNTPSLQTAHDVLTKFPDINADWLMRGFGRKKTAENEAEQANLSATVRMLTAMLQQKEQQLEQLRQM